jgi:hypothetical protein
MISRCYISWSYEYGHEVVDQLLLDQANVDMESEDSMEGLSPLSYAVEIGHEGVVNMLLARF